MSDEISLAIIHTGMLKHFKDDDDLAVILAHEVAHVVANHYGERRSRKILGYLYGIPYVPFGIIGTLSLCVAMVTEPQIAVGGLLLIPFAVGKLMNLSTCRKQEEEADTIGLLLMTEAGYNPYAARRVYGSMKAEEDQVFAAAQARARQISQATGRPMMVSKVPEHERTHPLVSIAI